MSFGTVSATTYNVRCGLFAFILDAALLGSLCLLGFAGGTLALLVLWRERRSVLLLVVLVLADVATLWILFVGDVMPALAYVLPLLRDCYLVCGYVTAVTAPLLLFAQFCAVWLTVLAVAHRYCCLCRPATTAGQWRKPVIAVVLLAVLLALPRTFDSTLLVDGGVVLSQHWLYARIYGAVLLTALLLPLGALVYLTVRLGAALHSLRRLRRALATEHTDDLTQLLLTLAVSLLICYCPLLALRAAEWRGTDTQCGQLLYYLDSFSKMFVALNSALKLPLLAVFATRFGHALRDTFCGSGGSEPRVFSMYRCADASEMTLISQLDRNDDAIEPLQPA